MDERADTAAPAAYSGAELRERHARSFLLWVRPAIVIVAIMLTTINALSNPNALTTGNWVSLVAFLLMQPVYVLLVLRTRMLSTTAIAIAFVIDGVIMLYAVLSVKEPDASASTYLVLLVAVSYFRPPRDILLYAFASALALAIAAPNVAAWDDPGTIPSASFTIVVCGVLLAVLSQQRRVAEGRIEGLVHEQRVALERLRQVNDARDRLIANVSHELRTPLTSTIGAVETMLRDDIELPPNERHRLMQLARDGGRRLLALVEDLLAIESTRPDAIVLDPEPADIADIARHAAEGLTPGPGRELIVHEDAHVAVRVDRRRIEQVLSNLVVNAVHHGDGRIDIVCTEGADHHAVVDVIDEGDGVPAEHLEELFQPFAKFSTRTDSTGLGLAISRTVVEAHGGTIRYDRLDDGRTRFRVDLPGAAPQVRDRVGVR